MTLLAFLRKDLQNEASYRMYFLWRVGSLVFSVVGLFFLSGMFAGPLPSLASYGGDYFSFALIGLALTEAMVACLNSFSAAVRYEQVVGTLEAMAATPTRLGRILFYSGLYPLFYSGLRSVLSLGLGIALGAQIGLLPLLRAIPVFVLTMVTFGALGVISASMILVLRRSDPVGMLLGAVSFLFSGALYPLTAIPESLRTISYFLPITYALEAARKLVLSGATLAEVSNEVGILALFALICTVLAASAIRWAARTTTAGGIRHY